MAWRVDGVEYDLESFARVHPGGAIAIMETRGQDISTLFYTQHRDASRFLPLLSRFVVDPASKSTSQRPLHDETGFLKALHEQLGTQRWLEAVALSNTAFAAVLFSLAGVYGLLQWRALVGVLKPVPYAALMAIVRICMTVGGKRFALRRPTLVNVTLSFLTDLDYRGSALAAYEARLGNQLPQPTTLRRLQRLPRGTRVALDVCRACLFPLATAVALGSLLRRLASPQWSYQLRQFIGCLFMRGLLVAELVLFVQSGKLDYWMMQCLLTTWLSLLLTLCVPLIPPSTPETWLSTQLTVKNLVLTGNRYLDAILTGGLSCERVHRLIPFQWSPFANIVVEPLIAQFAQEKNLPWSAAVPLLTDILPNAMRNCFLGTSELKPLPVSLWQEHISWSAFCESWGYLWESLFIEDERMSDPLKRE